MAQKINPLSYPYVRALFYGVPGSWKTRTVGTAAAYSSTAPSLMLETGGNPISIMDYAEQPDIIQMDKLEDYNEPYDWIMKGQPAKHRLVEMFDLRPPYKSLLLDQLTQTQYMYFDKVMGLSSYGPGTVVPRREWGHYNAVLYSMLNFANLYMNVPMHVFAVAQEREGDTTEHRLTRPLLEGRSEVEIPSWAFIVARIQQINQVEPAARKLLLSKEPGANCVAFFTPGDTYYAKDQYGRLGKYMVNPTVEKIMTLLGK